MAFLNSTRRVINRIFSTFGNRFRKSRIPLKRLSFQSKESRYFTSTGRDLPRNRSQNQLPGRFPHNTTGDVFPLQFQENRIFRSASFVTVACQQGLDNHCPRDKAFSANTLFRTRTWSTFQRFHKKGHFKINKIFLDGVNRQSRILDNC